jgi:AcrR family transcriptional regulator
MCHYGTSQKMRQEAERTSRGVTRDSQKARTRRDLVDAARTLIAAGGLPSISEVADAASVSRRTAYRYFASADQLATEAVLEGLRTDVEHEIDSGGSGEGMTTRVGRLVTALHEMTRTNERLLRQMVRFTIDRGQIAVGVPPRPSRRLEYVERALVPLRDELSAAQYERLVHAMAVVIGIEARIVLEDICGLDDRQILATEQWAAQALLAAATREST